MSSMSRLAEELAELKRCGEVLISISETLTQMFSTDTPQLEQDTTETPPETKPETKPEQVEAETPDKAKPLTLQDVRPILAEKSRAGHTAAIREILKKHGSPNLSGIDPAEYPALLAEVEVL